MEEREYQITAVTKMVKFLRNPDSKGGEISIAPTGAGKSYIIAMIVKALPEYTIVVVQPSVVLLEQNFGKMVELGITPTIYSGSLNSREVSRVTYATVRSLRSSDFKNKKNLLVLMDECHLETAGDQYGNSLIKTFLKEVGIKSWGGFTATPLYLKGGKEGSVLRMMTSIRGALFKRINHCIQIKEMVDGNFWAKVAYDVQVIDTTNLVSNTSGSEFSELTVNQFYKSNNLFERIKGCTEYHSDRKSVLIFVPGIEEAKNLCAFIPGSEYIASTTSAKDRKRIIEGFKDLSIRILINVNILSVGFDHPRLDHIIDANPTMSFTRHYQKWGRGVRRHPDKEYCIITDFAGAFNKFGRLEDINFENIPDYGFELFIQDYLISGIPLELKKRPQKKDLVNNRERVRNIKKASKDSPKFPFGKYKGMTVDQIHMKDRGYLIWLISEKTGFKFETQAMKKIKSIIEQILTT